MLRANKQAKADGDRLPVCSACGGTSVRGSAHFCIVCGKSLDEGYQPLDTIRSSYGLQRKRLGYVSRRTREGPELFLDSRNTLSDTAWACVVYSLVPYLGILFVPFALVFGGYGYIVGRRRPDIGGRRLAAYSIGLSVFILLVQLFLWWLLYIIPEIGI